MVRDKVREVWRQALHLETFSDDDDFFAIGGHSLIMSNIQVRISEVLGVEVPMDELFEHSTVTKISAHIEALNMSV